MKRVLLLLPLLFIWGCGLRDSSVVGSYRGDAPPKSSADAHDVGNQIASGLSHSVSLELKADHTFNMVALIVPISGKWELSGNTVTCTPTAIFGYDAKSPDAKSFQFTADGTHLDPIGNDHGPADFRFVKQSQ